MPTAGRELWFQQHDLVTESVVQSDVSKIISKLSGPMTILLVDLEGRGLFKDSFSKDQVLSSSTRYT